MTYKLTHPDDPAAEVKVDAEQVSLYTAQGWQAVAAPAVVKKTAAPAKKAAARRRRK